jgi:hypothetical protein
LKIPIILYRGKKAEKEQVLYKNDEMPEKDNCLPQVQQG